MQVGERRVATGEGRRDGLLGGGIDCVGIVVGGEQDAPVRIEQQHVGVAIRIALDFESPLPVRPQVGFLGGRAPCRQRPPEERTCRRPASVAQALLSPLQDPADLQFADGGDVLIFLLVDRSVSWR